MAAQKMMITLLLITLVVVVVLVLGVIITLVSRRIASPLSRLSMFSQQIALGNLSDKLNMNQNDEKSMKRGYFPHCYFKD